MIFIPSNTKNLQNYFQIYLYKSHILNNQQSNQLYKQMSAKHLKCCHLCLLSLTPYSQCCKPSCRTVYCQKCIRQQFDPYFNCHAYVQQCWICYACGGRCKCLRCVGINGDRKGKVNLSGLEKKKIEKSITIESPSPKENCRGQNQQQNINKDKRLQVIGNHHLFRKYCMSAIYGASEEKKYYDNLRKMLDSGIE